MALRFIATGQAPDTRQVAEDVTVMDFATAKDKRPATSLEVAMCVYRGEGGGWVRGHHQRHDPHSHRGPRRPLDPPRKQSVNALDVTVPLLVLGSPSSLSPADETGARCPASSPAANK